MEMILGVIEDLIDKYENGTPEEKEDALNSLKLEREQFLRNLQPLIDAGNGDAKKIFEKLQSIAI
ncbi:MAG: hypothetical protein DRO88_13130 [Promethearchaeia archaeon]|nr:MAG: hypothetical protein DRO88_13130 [Candidatus Lokiarchaeia archaeon]